MAQSYEFPSHRSGDTFNGVQFTINVNSSPVDLTGAVISFQLGPNLFSTSNERLTITNAAGGVFQVNEQVITVPPKKYRFDVRINFANGKVKTYISLTIRVLYI